jgi:predicted nucleotidyltransferase
MSSSILQKYRAEILDLALSHGVRNVRVFGSLARGEGREDSDLDLLVTLAEGRSPKDARLWSLKKLSLHIYESRPLLEPNEKAL